MNREKNSTILTAVHVLQDLPEQMCKSILRTLQSIHTKQLSQRSKTWEDATRTYSKNTEDDFAEEMATARKIGNAIGDGLFRMHGNVDMSVERRREKPHQVRPSKLSSLSQQATAISQLLNSSD